MPSCADYVAYVLGVGTCRSAHLAGPTGDCTTDVIFIVFNISLRCINIALVYFIDNFNLHIINCSYVSIMIYDLSKHKKWISVSVVVFNKVNRVISGNYKKVKIIDNYL